MMLAYTKTDLWDKYKKAEKLRQCGSKLVFGETESGEHILLAGYFCQLRLCPQCSWKRAKRVFENVYSVITQPEFAGKKFIFLTLTVKNCEGEFLESEINRLLSAWRSLTKDGRKPFRRSFLGTFRALEVTYNKLTKTYHPHLHAMAAVEPGYFRKSNKNYIGQAKLREIWRDACGLDYLPQCRIQRVKNAAEKQVAEVAKYTVKSADYIDRPEVLQVLDPALHRKRLIAYGGLFQEVRDRLALPYEDIAEADVSPGVAAAAIANPYVRKIFLEWHLGAYRVVADSMTDSGGGTVVLADAASWGQGGE